ncbi:PEGA domain-containing protein [candidate division KSB1 bacterium]|nr:PEGA domain-containing protein [candidate division KSB1 bacterium]
MGIILSIGGFVIWMVQKFSEEKYGKLRIVSNVDSARVFLAKDFKRFTSANKAIGIDSLEPGSYVLSVEKDGFAAFDANVSIVAGEITSVKVELRLAQAPTESLAVVSKPATNSTATKPAGAVNSYQITITVHSKLKNADIMIDGKWEANAPATISLSKGRYRLRIENEAYYYEETLRAPSRNIVNVTEDEIKKILNDLP